jgi:hypothetical protein
MLIYASPARHQLEHSALMSASTTIPVVATVTGITALVERQRFASYDDFKIALKDWEIAEVLLCTARMGKSEAECVTSVCAIPSCPFYIRAAYSPKEECVIVTTLQGQHNCIGAAPVKRPA